MGIDQYKIDDRISKFSSALILISSFIGLLYAIGWLIDQTFIPSVYKTMAPFTSVLSILIGLIVYFIFNKLQTPRFTMFCKIVLYIIGFVISFILFDTLLGLKIDIEQIFIINPPLLKDTPIRRISPITAVLFLVCIFSSISNLFNKKPAVFAINTALLIILIFDIGYLFSTPILYGRTIIPPSLPASIALTLLLFGIWLNIGQNRFPLNLFLGNSIHSKLLRNFLPVTVILILFMGWINSLGFKLFGESALVSAVATILSMFIIGFVILKTANSTAQKINKAIEEKIKAENDLIDSEDKFRMIFENTSVGIAIIEPDSTFSMVNSAYCDMIGYKPEELIGQSWTEQIPPDDLVRMKEYSRKRMINPDDAPNKYEFTFYHKNGKILHGLLSVSVMQKNKKIIVSFTDITERKHAEQLLKQSQERFRNAVMFAPFPIIIFAETGNIEFINDELLDLTGYKSEEITTIEQWVNLAYKEKAVEMLENFQQVFLIDRKTDFGEHLIYTKNNEKQIWHFNTAPLGKTAEGKTIIICMAMNLTKRKAAEEEIKLNDKRLESLLRLSHYKASTVVEFLDYALEEAVLLTQSKIGYIYFYDEKTELFTLNSWSNSVMEECTIAEKQRVYQLEYTGLWGEVVRSRKQIIVNNFTAKNPLKKGYPNGHAKLLKFMSVPVIVDNKIIAVVGVANKETDYNEADAKHLSLMMDSVWRITERIETGIKLENYAEELKISNAAKDKFLSIIAHDLRNPFNAFLGITDIIIEDIETLSKTEILDFVNDLNIALKQQFYLLNDLLHWAKLQSKNFNLTTANANVKIEVNYVMEQLAFNAAHKQVLLTNDVNNNICVIADINMLRLILRNLISNSIKFTNSYGIITISANILPNFIEIAVADTGVGIAANDLNNLFKNNIRYTTDGTKNEKGTGLGLLLCKEIVEKHGGKIWVESELNKGTKISFTMPKGQTLEIDLD